MDVYSCNVLTKPRAGKGWRTTETSFTVSGNRKLYSNVGRHLAALHNDIIIL